MALHFDAAQATAGDVVSARPFTPAERLRKHARLHHAAASARSYANTAALRPSKTTRVETIRIHDLSRGAMVVQIVPAVAHQSGTDSAVARPDDASVFKDGTYAGDA